MDLGKIVTQIKSSVDLDKITSQMKSKVEHIKEGVSKQAEAPHMKMKVCMLGARGVGKTSVITSMYNSQKEAVKGTGLFLSADSDTEKILESKREDLKGIFYGIHKEKELITESGISGDDSESAFSFSYGMNSEKVNIDLEIRDYPGEYLKSEPELVAGFVREASAIMIAIDTPCLMEENGKYHLAKNRLDLVSKFLMTYLDNTEEKLILFVPLKCEKYYCEGRINEVTDAVKHQYDGLIQYLRDKDNMQGFKKKICCAITPIQTLGDVAFDSFARDEMGNIKEVTTKDGMKLPAEIRYHYTKSNAVYNPVNCVQPLYYLLAFISKQYEKSRQEQTSSGLIGRLKETLRLIPNVESFLLEIQRLGIKRIENAQGYKVLFGHGRI